MKNLICIVCPKGCRLQVADQGELVVSGHGCARGEAYAIAELRNPTRVLTSTVALVGAAIRRCPVKTDGAIPKGLLFAAMEEVNAATVSAPVAIGTIVVRNVCGTGVDIVATRDISAETASACVT